MSQTPDDDTLMTRRLAVDLLRVEERLRVAPFGRRRPATEGTATRPGIRRGRLACTCRHVLLLHRVGGSSSAAASRAVNKPGVVLARASAIR